MAVYVTKYLSAIWHAILDNFRPITIWVLDLYIYYSLYPGTGNFNVFQYNVVFFSIMRDRRVVTLLLMKSFNLFWLQVPHNLFEFSLFQAAFNVLSNCYSRFLPPSSKSLTYRTSLSPISSHHHYCYCIRSVFNFNSPLRTSISPCSSSSLIFTLFLLFYIAPHLRFSPAFGEKWVNPGSYIQLAGLLVSTDTVRFIYQLNR